MKISDWGINVKLCNKGIRRLQSIEKIFVLKFKYIRLSLKKYVRLMKIYSKNRQIWMNKSKILIKSYKLIQNSLENAITRYTEWNNRYLI